MRSAQKVGDAVRLVGASAVERRLPGRDFAVAHDPDFDAEAPHGGAALCVLPFAFPDVGDGVVHQRAEAFLEPIALLLAAARGEEGAQRFATAKLRHRPETHHAIVGEPGDERIDSRA
jgi:hypothetical protein